MKPATGNFAETARLIGDLDDFAVAAHVKPDGDATGSVMGMTRLLGALGKKAVALLPGGLPAKYRALYPDSTTAESLADIPGCRTLLLLDCANIERAGLGENAVLPPGVKLFNIDHHVDNHIAGDWNVVVPAAATAEIVAGIARDGKWRMTPAAATWLLLGIVTDTGSFRFSNTDGAVLRSAAWLLDEGAELEKVANGAFFSKPVNEQKFEAELVLSGIHEYYQGRLRIAAASGELIDKYHFNMRDSETIVERVREIEGVIVAILVYPFNGTVKASLRSKDARFPVAPVARRHGGGGHEMAAGITFADKTIDEVCEILKQDFSELEHL